MKSLNTYIAEKLNLSEARKSEYTLFPKDKDELVEMIYV